jgi:AraC-like DNA-binding protein
MNKLQFTFAEVDSDLSFSRLAEVTGSKLIQGVIYIPAEKGSGLIKKVKFEEGLTMRAWNFRLHEPMIISKVPDTTTGGDKYYHIGYILHPEGIMLKNNDIKKDVKTHVGMNIVFISCDSQMDFEIAPESGLQAIDISVSSSWLKQAFKDTDASFLAFLEQIEKNPHPSIFMESSPAAEYRMLADLHTTTLSEVNGSLHVKAGVLSLVSDFFGRIFHRSPHEVLESRTLHSEKMVEVEKILTTHMEKSLPSIESIARSVMLSESTLKRHFKLMFGKSLYEYYLEMKMEYAKRILIEKPISVNEVAAILDYEKVSNFIEMFKKHHGFSPGSIRKNNTIKDKDI